MALPTSTFITYDAKGLREDLTDTISRIDPTEVPFTSNIGRSKASATAHEWQIQTLATAVATNAVIEGDDATTDATTATTRIKNYTQISDKVARVTGTIVSADKAGRASEMAYQVLLKGLELRRDMEAQMTQNKASVAGTSAIARVSASFESWLSTNTVRDASGTTNGANGGFSATTGLVAAPTDSDTQVTFTEAMVKSVMSSCFTAGGKPKLVLVGPFNKQKFSGFTGIAEARVAVSGANTTMIIGAADIYVSDFGNLAITAAQFVRTRSALFVDPKMAKLAFLRPMKNWELAKTGDTTQRQVLCEYTLEMSNEAAHGIVADLSTS